MCIEDPRALKQIEKGEFFFALARLEVRSKQPVNNVKSYTQEPLLLLAIYFFWNVFFAYTSWIYIKKDNTHVETVHVHG